MNATGEDIPFLLQEYADAGKKISSSVYQIMLYGNGITREEAFNLTYNERVELVKLMEEKVKAESGQLK